MIEIENADIKIYANRVCKAVRSQLNQMGSLHGYDNNHIRVMPNASRGYKSINGFTGKLGGHINPAMCGTDIGCGVLVQNLGAIDIDFFTLQNHLVANVPTGGNIRNHDYTFESDACHKIDMSAKGIIKRLHCWYDHVEKSRVSRSIGTLGGGNHFVELDIDEKTGYTYLLIHTGSRLFGKVITSKINTTLEATNTTNSAYRDYYDLCSDWACLNRKMIAQIVCEYLKVEAIDSIDIVHNYAGDISRKGAISAEKGEPCVILLGEEQGVMLCEGKGNDEWNCSAPVGIGPDMELGEFINLIRPTVNIKRILTPIFSYKGTY